MLPDFVSEGGTLLGHGEEQLRQWDHKLFPQHRAGREPWDERGRQKRRKERRRCTLPQMLQSNSCKKTQQTPENVIGSQN